MYGMITTLLGPDQENAGLLKRFDSRCDERDEYGSELPETCNT